MSRGASYGLRGAGYGLRGADYVLRGARCGVVPIVLVVVLVLVIEIAEYISMIGFRIICEIL